MANPPFIEPPHHVPDGVIGDTVDEIKPKFVEPPHNSAIGNAGPPFIQPPYHSLEGVKGFSPEDVEPKFNVPALPPIKTEIRDHSEQQKYVPPDLDYSKIINQLASTDRELSKFLRDLGSIDNEYAPVSIGGGAGMSSLDPYVTGNYLLMIAKALGVTGLARFIGTQTLLYSMNPETSKVFNPGYFVNRVPLLNGETRLTLDEETHTDIENAREKIKQTNTQQALTTLDKTGLKYVQTPVDDIRELNMNYSENTYSEAAAVTVGGLVDAALGDMRSTDGQLAAPLIEYDSTTGRNKISANAFFEERKTTIGIVQAPKTKFSAKATGRSAADRGASAGLARSAYARGIVPASFDSDDEDGLIRTLGEQKPSSRLDDDDAYVPLSFTDLRKKGNETRTVYFRPFITSFNESFAPSWSSDNYFGRVDPVKKYENTTRTVSLGFELHAFSPEDLKVIYQKLNWLTSLVYPEYDKDLLFRSGPVCKMRIGDIISSQAGEGQSGVIESLDFDYTDALWELKKGHKVPRSVSVSLSFTALHSGPVGLFNGRFGVLSQTVNKEEVETSKNTTYTQFVPGGRGATLLITTSETSTETITTTETNVSNLKGFPGV